MKTNSLYLLILAVIAFSSCGPSHSSKQETTVTFTSDIEIDVELREPFDGFANSFYVTRTLHLLPGIPQECKVDIDDWGYLRFSHITRDYPYSVLLLEGDRTEINLYPNEVRYEIEGDNAEGKEYFIERYDIGLGNHYTAVDSLFRASIKDSVDFRKINEGICRWEESRFYKKDIQNMLDEGRITPKFARLLSEECRRGDVETLSLAYREALNGRRYNRYKPTQEECGRLWHAWGQLMEDPVMNGPDMTKFLYGSSVSMYYETMYYRFTDEAKKDSIKAEYEPLFGYLRYMMLAPKERQYHFFAMDASYRLKTNTPLYEDPERFIRWLQDNFPDRKYTDAIVGLWNERQTRLNQKVETVFLDGKSIRNFKDLAGQNPLKGKRLFIDLWASWCSPCLAQFKYDRQIRHALQKRNITPVYISVDEDRNDSIWREQIRFHKVEGYHLRASEALKGYLKKQVYEGKPLQVPRYMLLDEEGNVLVGRLPQPSRIEELEKALDKALERV